MIMAKFYAVRQGVTPGIYTSWKDCEAQVKGFPNAEYKSFMSEEDARAYCEEVFVSTKVNESTEVEEEVIEETIPVDYDELSDKADEAIKFLKDNNLISDESYNKIAKEIEIRLVGQKIREDAIKARNGKPFPSHVDIYVDGSYNSETNDFGYGVYMNDGEKSHILYGRGPCQENGRNVEGEVAASRKALQYISLNPQYSSVTIYHDYEGVGKWADHSWKTNLAYNQAYVRYVDRIRESLKVEFKHVKGHEGVEGNEIVDKLAKIGCGVGLTPSEEKFIGKYAAVPGYPQSFETPESDKAVEYTMMGDYMP